MHNNELFVDHLIQKSGKITVEKSPLLRVIPWCLALILYMSAVIALLIGFRPDIHEALSAARLQFEVSLSLLTGLFCLIATSYLRIPQSKAQKPWIFIASTAVSVQCFYLIYRLIHEGFLFAHLSHYKGCFLHAIALSTVPAILLVWMSKNATVVYPKLCGFFTTFAIAGFAWAGLRLTCPIDLAEHNAIIQVIPFILIGLIFGKGSKDFFKW